MLWKNRNRPLGPRIGPIYSQIEDLRANSPEDPTYAFVLGGVFSIVISSPILFIIIIFGASLGA